MIYLYDNIPLIDLTRPKVLSHSKTKRNKTEEIIKQNLVDAEKVLTSAGLGIDKHSYNVIEPSEKYMIETQPDNAVKSPTKKTATDTMRRGLQKPHYTHLLKFQDKIVFQAACCLPLRIFAASLDSNIVSGRVLLSSHSKKNGGKLAYVFSGKGKKVIIDLKRGESSKVQRLFFTI